MKCNCNANQIRNELDRIHKNKMAGQYKTMDGYKALKLLKMVKSNLTILRPNHTELMLDNWQDHKDYGSSLELWEFLSNDLSTVIKRLEILNDLVTLKKD